jgi:acyl-coenzyme A thioesterase PaaI-like protein
MADPSDPIIFDRIAAYKANRLDVPGPWAAKRELTKELRKLLDAMCSTNASEVELRQSAAEVANITRRISAQPKMEDRPGVAEVALTGMETFHDRSPLVGASNPLAPPIDMAPDHETGLVEGTVVFGSAYEGAPGCVHGGFVAAAFDEALGMACIFSGNPAMTGEITIRYEKPTPLKTELRFRAWLDRIEGRKVYTKGELHAGDLLVARSHGVFIAITFEKFAALEEDRKRRGV